VERQRDFVFTSVPTVLSVILRLIVLAFLCLRIVPRANVSDDQGLIELSTLNIDYFKSKPSELPKTTILLDKE
jgi:hypothetical protein